MVQTLVAVGAKRALQDDDWGPPPSPPKRAKSSRSSGSTMSARTVVSYNHSSDATVRQPSVGSLSDGHSEIEELNELINEHVEQVEQPPRSATPALPETPPQSFTPAPIGDRTISVREHTFDDDQVNAWVEMLKAGRRTLSKKEIKELKRKATDATKARNYKNPKPLPRDAIIEIAKWRFSTDAPQGIIAELCGSSQTNVSNFEKWIKAELEQYL